MIPKILHQTWKSDAIPPRWQRFQETFRQQNPGWQIMFWSDAQGREFMAREYGWFLPIYDAYPEPIMRADALRYFLLSHHGGVYADMDYECLRPLDGLLRGREVIAGCEPAEHLATVSELRDRGLSYVVCNALIGSVPGHPFWQHIFRYLEQYAKHTGPLESTGPILFTRAWQSFDQPSTLWLLDSMVLSPFSQREAYAGEAEDPQRRATLTESSYAIHHWDNSWFAKPQIDLDPGNGVAVNLLLRRRILSHGTVRPNVLREMKRAGERTPLISCLMVTQRRAAQAKAAVQSFLNQTWKERELVILDDSPEDFGSEALKEHLIMLADSRIHYKRLAPEGLPLGDLRNLAIGEAAGEFIAQWDDDDLSHPQRLEIQMAALEVMAADAAFLQRQLIWWPREERLAVSRSRVWESTILCRKCRLPAYPSLVRAEDTPVVSKMMNELRLALVDAPNLYMYVRHGSNTFEEPHFDKQWELADTRYQGRAYRGMRDALSARFPLHGYAEALGAPSMPRRDTIRMPNGSTGYAVAKPSGANFSSQKILILTPVKNGRRWIARHVQNLLSLEHPHAQISLGFLESDSTDGTFEALQAQQKTLTGEFRRVHIAQEHFGFYPQVPRWEPSIQLQRRSVLARSRNHLLLQSLRDEDWVLWIDVDVQEYPADVIAQLLSVRKDILVPNCVNEYDGASFDLNTFQLVRDGSAMHASVHLTGDAAPRGHGRRYLHELRDSELVPVDAVGGAMLLVKASLHRDGLIFPPFPYKDHIETEGLAVMARDMGVQSWGLPNLQIVHPRE